MVRISPADARLGPGAMSGSSKRRRRAEKSIPPRGPALRDRPMLLSFDVDCGALIRGHRFIARGLCDQGTIQREESPSGCPVFDLEYELVPGVPPEGEDRPFLYLVGIEYEADVPLPWFPNDGGVIAPFQGGSSTHGSRGVWPLPPAARVLRFVISGIDPASGFSHVVPDGVLIVDLEAGSAVWKPLR
jgi:hypothetical protein